MISRESTVTCPAAPQEPGASRIDVSRDDDACLLFYMGEAGSDRVLADAALREFIKRHWKIVIGFCRTKRYETFGKSADDFVSATFQRAYKFANRFSVK